MRYTCKVNKLDMDKFSFIALWDVYGGLLTDNQREITNLYFNLDLTVSEIAEEKQISRQAVSDCLKLCKNTLEEYENKLGFARILRNINLEISFKITDALKWADEHAERCDGVDKLKEILGGDYSGQVAETLKDPSNLAVLTKDYTKEVFGRKKNGEE